MHDIKQKINKHKIKSENQLKFCGSMAKMSIEWQNKPSIFLFINYCVVLDWCSGLPSKSMS